MRYILRHKYGCRLFLGIFLALFLPSRAIALICPADSSEVQSYIGDFEGYDTSLAQTTFGTTPDPQAFLMLAGDIPDWDTTASDDLIEIWDSGHNSTPSQEGDYHAELSANEPSTLFRDITAPEDDIILWSVWHRGRVGTDVANVILDDPAANSNVEQVMSTGNTSWQNYSGTYVVPAGQPQTRFSLTSVSSASPLAGAGNFIDLVEITVCRPNPPAMVDVAKTSSLFLTGAPEGVFAVPGQDMIYSVTVSNIGGSAATSDSVIVIDQLPAQITFLNDDLDAGGPDVHPGNDPIAFTDNGSGLSFSFSSDVAFSDSVTVPSDFSDCSYTPSSGYDPNIRHICINPKGAFAAPAPNSSFTVSFRARID